MLTETKNLPNSRVKLTITANAHQFRHAFGHELENVSKGVTIQGFRAGKAPAAKVIEKVGRQRIEAEAIDHTISEVYFEAMQDAKLVPVEPPKVEVKEYVAPADDAADDTKVLTFTVEVDVIPKVKIDGYEKIKIKNHEKPFVKDDEVEKTIEYLRKQQATLKEGEPATVLEDGMWADLGYEGSVGGVKRTDMKNEHHPLVIGEGQLIPGFEEALIGMKIGEKRTIHPTFPKDYSSSELAGKKADFEVTLHELKRVELPEKDEKFAETFGHDSYEKLVEAIKKNLHEEKEQESKQKLEEEVLDQLLKVAKFETPQSLIEQELERMFNDSRERLAKMNFQWDTYLQQVGKTADQIKEEMRPQAEKNVRIGLALGKLMEEEKLEGKENAGRLAVDKLVEIATKGK
ncbi:MAG: trigger factor [bacterium]